jgi:hypothetical protein
LSITVSANRWTSFGFIDNLSRAQEPLYRTCVWLSIPIRESRQQVPSRLRK